MKSTCIDESDSLSDEKKKVGGGRERGMREEYESGEEEGGEEMRPMSQSREREKDQKRPRVGVRRGKKERRGTN